MVSTSCKYTENVQLIVLSFLWRFRQPQGILVVFQSVSKSFCYFVFLWDNSKKYFELTQRYIISTFAMFNNIFFLMFG